MPSDTMSLVLTLGHVIEARVTRADGSPIEDASVEIWQPFPDFKRVDSTLTDEEGKAYLDWGYPGDYFILASKAAEITQSEFVQFSISKQAVASPNKFDLKCHGAPWYYTMTLTYDRAMTATKDQMAQIWEELKNIEASNPTLIFHNVEISGTDVIIDFELQAHSLLLIIALAVALLIKALPMIIIAIGIVATIYLVALRLTEAYKAPTPKKEFIAPDGTKFTDQASIASYLEGKGDPTPWLCAYEGCNLRFSTEAEKLTHINQYHKPAVFPWVSIAIVAAAAFVIIKIL